MCPWKMFRQPFSNYKAVEEIVFRVFAEPVNVHCLADAMTELPRLISVILQTRMDKINNAFSEPSFRVNLDKDCRRRIHPYLDNFRCSVGEMSRMRRFRSMPFQTIWRIQTTEAIEPGCIAIPGWRKSPWRHRRETCALFYVVTETLSPQHSPFLSYYYFFKTHTLGLLRVMTHYKLTI